ncbi:hypothetical protein GJU39_19970 [Pedobacter petrophilus]|uniref:Uncharacterized protein n=1 Tax=Pedobacter petrophilus TaxID=1908241 RepID=A0A7K0G3I1_9SPHI|nr:hypothetical protein [Pedobacter petrophilus]MRX78365.1 hypothetical protein [Pedobacter petrophilus]
MERKAKDVIIKEENKLPLTFEYMEFFGSKRSDNLDSGSSPYLKCKKYQTEFHNRQVLYKAMTRML